jgi:hypothetical protein
LRNNLSISGVIFCLKYIFIKEASFLASTLGVKLSILYI